MSWEDSEGTGIAKKDGALLGRAPLPGSPEILGVWEKKGVWEAPLRTFFRDLPRPFADQPFLSIVKSP